jgi:glycosyltransferase involved in cell wall biosynthesis
MMLSVVIATRDRAEFLSRALESLAAQQKAGAFEVIVVDNGSRDATAEVVAAYERAGTLPVRRLLVPEPNRGAARNRGIEAALGQVVVFVDDDVWLPEGFLAAHAHAHRGVLPLAVSGPILNVPSYAVRPKPAPFNYSAAFFCTCNVSAPRAALLAVAGFDERFDLYGWEDTELGLRLRRSGIQRGFAWDAYLYHIKPPASETLEVVTNKTIERAQMAARLLDKDHGLRAKLATGAYAPNLWRARFLAPAWLQPFYRRLAQSERLPRPLRDLARSQFLDVTYTSALRRALAGRGH